MDEVIDLTEDSPGGHWRTAGRGRAFALCAMETTASKGDVRAWLGSHQDDPTTIFDSLACVWLQVVPSNASNLELATLGLDARASRWPPWAPQGPGGWACGA